MDQTFNSIVQTVLDLFRDHLYAFLEEVFSSAFGRNWVNHARIRGCLQPEERENGMNLSNMLKIFEQQYDVIKFDLPPTFPKNFMPDLMNLNRKVKQRIVLTAKEAYEGTEIVARFMQYIQASNPTVLQYKEILREAMNKEVS